MDALEAALRPIANILNRNIHATTPARELCAKLDGTVVAVRVRDTALATFFVVHEDLLELVTESEQEPDVIISGSIVTLARMAGQSGESAIRDGSLDLSGDAETAHDFQRLLGLAKPDVKEELSGIIGDIAAHNLGSFARSLGHWGREVRSTMGANIREYLQEESRAAPSRYEVDRFSKDIGTLRDDVDRLEARLNGLESPP
jgi:ubiquinone biosynthesis protein UbiJ